MEIRRAKTVEEYKVVENIQRDIWGMIDEPPVPLPILVAINSNGGLVEIAKEGNKIIGFSLAFPGSNGNYRYLYSHMAGVLQEYRNKNVGYNIKMHQFEQARKMGYTEVRWTFDPMKARNAFFNVNKLGAYAYDYKINYYGIMGSKENQGVESDRIEAHKFLDREKIVTPNFEILARITDFPKPWQNFKIKGESVAIEVPGELGSNDLELAKSWRVTLRRAIMLLEENGYVMNNVIKEEKSALFVFTLREKLGI
ncbi:MAG: GNAT family N-acetyltransferase [Thermoplasmata archaeon]